MKRITAREITRNGKKCWSVIVPKDLSGGKQVRLFFNDTESNTGKELAVAKVRQLERDRAGVAAGFHRLDLKDQARVLILLDKVAGDVSRLEKAVEMFHKSGAGAERKISEVVTEMIWSKDAAGMRQRYLQTLKCSLSNFRDGVSVSKLGEVTPALVEKWLLTNNWTLATRKGYLTDVRTLFSFAIKRGYVTSNPASAVQRPRVEQKPPGIHAVEEAAMLLVAALENDPGLIGYIAPIYFGGLRPNESAKLSKEHIRESGLIEVTPDKSKTRRRRFIAINETLAAWLAVEGVEFGPKNIKRRLSRLRAILDGKNEFPWPHDCLRHSFCSYGVPRFGAKLVAEWAGHSEGVLFAHYRERVKPADVERFWAIRPT